MIDVFDKFMYVVPIKGKQEGDVASGMIECLNKMGKKPRIIYTDDEGALNKEAIQKYLKDENIEHHRTRAHPNFSERAIRTFKDMLYKRVEADEKKGKQNIQWPDYIIKGVCKNDFELFSTLAFCVGRNSKGKTTDGHSWFCRGACMEVSVGVGAAICSSTLSSFSREGHLWKNTAWECSDLKLPVGLGNGKARV